MAHVFNYKDSLDYQKWLENPRNKFSVNFENALMASMFKNLNGKTILDIGCGSGLSSISLIDNGFDVTGLEPSHHMINLAEKNLGKKAEIYLGFAEHLPFEDNYFDFVCLDKTLEFVEDPYQALFEAFRVAKNAVFIGFINKYSLRALKIKINKFFENSVYDFANLFSLWEIKANAYKILGNVPIFWRTGFNKVFKKQIFSGFIGVVIIPVPRFKMYFETPNYKIKLALTCSSNLSVKNKKI